MKYVTDKSTKNCSVVYVETMGEDSAAIQVHEVILEMNTVC